MDGGNEMLSKNSFEMVITELSSTKLKAMMINFENCVRYISKLE